MHRTCTNSNPILSSYALGTENDFADVGSRSEIHMQIFLLELITRRNGTMEGESVNYAVMASMGAYILRDNGPDAANAILREALSA